MDTVTFPSPRRPEPTRFRSRIDLLIDFRDVAVVRSGKTLVGPVSWQVELDERWVIIGPSRAGKTTLMRLAAGELYPTTGEAFVLNEKLGRVELRELTTRIGMAGPGLLDRIPDDELVRDVVVSAGYSVLGRWRNSTTTSTVSARWSRWSRWAPSISPTGYSAPCRRAQARGHRAGTDDRPRDAIAG